MGQYNVETGVLIKFSVSLNFYYVYITLNLLQEIPYILILQPT